MNTSGVIVENGMGSLVEDLADINNMLDRARRKYRRRCRNYGGRAEDPLAWLIGDPFRKQIQDRWDARRLARQTAAAIPGYVKSRRL